MYAWWKKLARSVPPGSVTCTSVFHSGLPVATAAGSVPMGPWLPSTPTAAASTASASTSGAQPKVVESSPHTMRVLANPASSMATRSIFTNVAFHPRSFLPECSRSTVRLCASRAPRSQLTM